MYNDRMNNFKVKDLLLQSLVAAIYVSVSFMSAPWVYGNIQFRVAEILMVFVVFNPKYLMGVALGCFIVNISSELGLVDLVFGTLATLLAGYLMTKTKNIYIALLWPAIVNGIIIGAELSMVFSLPFILSALQVFFGEFVVVFIGGRLLYELIERNDGFKRMIQN